MWTSRRKQQQQEQAQPRGPDSAAEATTTLYSEASKTMSSTYQSVTERIAAYNATVTASMSSGPKKEQTTEQDGTEIRGASSSPPDHDAEVPTNEGTALPDSDNAPVVQAASRWSWRKKSSGEVSGKSNRTSKTASTRLSDASLATDEEEEDEDIPLTPEEERLVAALAAKAYHLEGNSYCQDFLQFFNNNHPLFSLCLQHRLHPISKTMRFVGLAGSIVFGLAMTNIMWLLFINNQEEQEAAFRISAGGFTIKNGTEFVLLDENHTLSRISEVEVTGGMALLWTIGSMIHGIYDQTIWYATSCACCAAAERHLNRYKRLRGYGNILVTLSVVLLVAMTTLIVVVRANMGQDSEIDLSAIRSAGLVDDTIEFDVEKLKDGKNYEFMMSFAFELLLSWFFFFPLIETILFSGILSCNGRFQTCGGRPYELRQELMSREDPELEEDVEVVLDDEEACVSSKPVDDPPACKDAAEQCPSSKKQAAEDKRY